jgi:hypothetical protein
MHEYLSWEELEQDDLPVSDGLVDNDAVTAQLASLLRQRARLEEDMLRLLGKAPAHPDEARERALFPMPVHTPESRMEDRRIARENERAHAAERRALEAARIKAQEDREHLQRKRDLEREAIQQQVLRTAEQNRKEQRQQHAARESLAAQLVFQRWTLQRTAARRARDASRRQEWLFFEQHAELCRESAAERSRMRRDELAELEARLARRSEQVARRNAARRAEGFAALDVDE